MQHRAKHGQAVVATQSRRDAVRDDAERAADGRLLADNRAGFDEARVADGPHTHDV
jgi:hypothetical protein